MKQLIQYAPSVVKAKSHGWNLNFENDSSLLFFKNHPNKIHEIMVRIIYSDCDGIQFSSWNTFRRKTLFIIIGRL